MSDPVINNAVKDFYNDISLKYDDVSQNYPLYKMAELYDGVSDYFDQIKENLYSTNIVNPLDIAGDNLVMWIDPSNVNFVSVDGNNNIINNANGFALYDKSTYQNNYSVVAGGTGLTYDSTKKMIKHLGGANLSAFECLTLVGKNANHFTTANSPFSFFIVIEDSENWNFSSVSYRGIWYMGNTGNNRPSLVTKSVGGGGWGSASGGFYQDTNVCHPCNRSISSNSYNLGKRAIIGMVFGVVNGTPYKDLYYNGLFCSRTIDNTQGVRSNNIFLGKWTAALNDKYEGFTGEQILIDRELTRTEVVKICEYLNNKWEVYSPRLCDVFVTAGQSNMVGRGNPTGGTNPSATNLQILGSEYGFYCDPSLIYTTSETPISCCRGLNTGQISFWNTSNNTATPNNVIVAVQASNSVGSDRVSCLSEFGNEYYNNTGRYAIFFAGAVGGTSLFNDNEWNPYLYEINLWSNIYKVIGPLKKKLTDNGFIVGKFNLLWHQGESDQNENINDYLNRLNYAFEQVINKFGYDNVFYYIVGNTGNSRTAQLQYNPSNSNIKSIFDTNILTQARLNRVNDGDTTHFNTIGQSIMGIEGGLMCASILSEDKTLILKSVKTTDTVTNNNVIVDGLFSDGTVTNPSISFENDQSTGIYKPSNGTLNISTSGIQRMSVNGTDLEVGTVSNQLNLITRGSISGSIFRAGNGAVGAPSYSFTSNEGLDTGMYFNYSGGTTDNLVFSVNGQNILNLGQGTGLTGISSINNKVLLNGGSSNNPILSLNNTSFSTGFSGDNSNNIWTLNAGSINTIHSTTGFDVGRTNVNNANMRTLTANGPSVFNTFTPDYSVILNTQLTTNRTDGNWYGIDCDVARGIYILGSNGSGAGVTRIAVSGANNLTSWTTYNESTFSYGNMKHVAYSPIADRWVVGTTASITANFFYSAGSGNTTTWTNIGNSAPFNVSRVFNKLKYINGQFIGLSTGSNLVFSSDGINWTLRQINATSYSLNDITYSQELRMYCIVTSSAVILYYYDTTSDGITLTTSFSVNSGTVYASANIGWSSKLSMFISQTGANANLWMRSSDGINWNSYSVSSVNLLQESIDWVNDFGGLFIGCQNATTNNCIVSRDGVNFTQIPLTISGQSRCMYYNSTTKTFVFGLDANASFKNAQTDFNNFIDPDNIYNTFNSNIIFNDNLEYKTQSFSPSLNNNRYTVSIFNKPIISFITSANDANILLQGISFNKIGTKFKIVKNTVTNNNVNILGYENCSLISPNGVVNNFTFNSNPNKYQIIPSGFYGSFDLTLIAGSQWLIDNLNIFDSTNVKYWGAVGDGITDDTAAIQAAFNNNTSLVYFPSGTYLVSGNGLICQNKNNIVVEFDNANIVFSGTAGQYCIRFSSCFDLIVRGALYLRNGVDGVNGIEVTDCRGCRISGINVEGVNNSTTGSVNQFNEGIKLDKPGGMPTPYYIYTFSLSDCQIKNCRYGIYVSDEYWNISNCMVTLCQYVGIYVDTTGGNFCIENCIVNGCCKGIYVEGNFSTGNSDHGSINSCTLNHNVFFGIHLRSIRYAVNINGCSIWATIASLPGYAYAMSGSTTVEPKQPIIPSYNSGTDVFGIYVENALSVNITGCDIARNIKNVGYAGMSLSNITSNTFITDSTRTTAHIQEMDNTVATSVLSNSQNNISNNTFNGLYTGGASNYLQKAIIFYTGVTGEWSSEYSVSNNTRTTGYNELYFSTILPDNQTYIIDPNYDSIIIDLATPIANRTLQLSTAMFGKSFKINAITSTGGINSRPFQISTNFNGNTIPSIMCGGIAYDSSTKTFTIGSIGEFEFSAVASDNTWIITNSSNPVMSTALNTGLNVLPSSIENMVIIDNVVTSQTIAFPSINSFNASQFGLSFYFSGNGSTTNNITIDNQTSKPILYFSKTGLISIATGSTSTISGNDLRHLFKCLYINTGISTYSWYIYQF